MTRDTDGSIACCNGKKHDQQHKIKKPSDKNDEKQVHWQCNNLMVKENTMQH